MVKNDGYVVLGVFDKDDQARSVAVISGFAQVEEWSSPIAWDFWVDASSIDEAITKAEAEARAEREVDRAEQEAERAERRKRGRARQAESVRDLEAVQVRDGLRWHAMMKDGHRPHDYARRGVDAFCGGRGPRREAARKTARWDDLSDAERCGTCAAEVRQVERSVALDESRP